jgi:hypothetical protein
MLSNGQPEYKVGYLPAAKQQIHDLAAGCTDHGQKKALASALKAMLAKLQTEPSIWGDPEYNLQKPGGCVYHGIIEPVIIRYAIYEHERIVLIMSVRLLLASDS